MIKFKLFRGLFLNMGAEYKIEMMMLLRQQKFNCFSFCRHFENMLKGSTIPLSIKRYLSCLMNWSFINLATSNLIQLKNMLIEPYTSPLIPMLYNRQLMGSNGYYLLSLFKESKSMPSLSSIALYSTKINTNIFACFSSVRCVFFSSLIVRESSFAFG